MSQGLHDVALERAKDALDSCRDGGAGAFVFVGAPPDSRPHPMCEPKTLDVVFTTKAQRHQGRLFLS
jgi:hypothetical protein